LFCYLSLDSGRPEHVTIAESLGCISGLAFSKDDTKLALCISNEIWVINTQV